MPPLSDSGETWESRPRVARTHLAAAVPSAVAPELVGLELVRSDSWVGPGPADSTVEVTPELSTGAAQTAGTIQEVRRQGF